MAKFVFDKILTGDEIKGILQKGLSSDFRVEAKKNRIQVVQDALRGCVIKLRENDGKTTCRGPHGYVPSIWLRLAMCLGCLVLMFLMVQAQGNSFIWNGVMPFAIPFTILILLIKVPSRELVGRVEGILAEAEAAGVAPLPTSLRNVPHTSSSQAVELSPTQTPDASQSRTAPAASRIPQRETATPLPQRHATPTGSSKVPKAAAIGLGVVTLAVIAATLFFSRSPEKASPRKEKEYYELQTHVYAYKASDTIAPLLQRHKSGNAIDVVVAPYDPTPSKSETGDCNGTYALFPDSVPASTFRDYVQSYVADAVEEEFQSAGLSSKYAGVQASQEIQVEVRKASFAVSSPAQTGQWRISATLVSGNGSTASADVEHEFATNIDEKTACEQVAQELPVSVQKLIHSIASSADFPRLLSSK
jgi:hypothetical protein